MGAEQGGVPIYYAYIIIFLIFYFLVLRPQKKEQKKKKEALNSIKKNDEVVTVGGIHATVVSVKDKTFIARVDDGVKIEFDKEAITTVVKKNKDADKPS